MQFAVLFRFDKTYKTARRLQYPSVKDVGADFRQDILEDLSLVLKISSHYPRKVGSLFCITPVRNSAKKIL